MPNIVETAIAAGSFQTLAAAITAAGLVDTLKGPGPFTVFAPGDAAFAKLTDETAKEMIKGPRGERSRLGMLVGNTTHANEEYGYMAVYLRLKGVVPPSSEGR